MSDPPPPSGRVPGFAEPPSGVTTSMTTPSVETGGAISGAGMSGSAPAKNSVPMRKLERRAGGRIVAGVAGGIADHLGVDPLKVRVAFAILAAMAGSGIVMYGMLWIFTSAGADTEKPSSAERQRAYGLMALGLGGAAALSWLFSGTAGSVLAPFFVVAIGAALVWREFDSEGPRTVIGLPQRPTVLTWTRVVGGTTLIVVGLAVVVLAQVDINALRSSLLAVVVTLIGVGLLTVPLWLRMWRALGAERAARIRNDEREEIASHLHDSVLQTLALIQKQSDDSAEVARLARGQERELRKWLFSGGDIDHTSLTEGLKIIAGEVEDQYGVTVRPVTVGDAQMAGDGVENGLPKEAFTALLGATREALVNSAKHSGEKEINLFAEVEGDQVSVFVRDRGVGFDIGAVPQDRQGLAKSIHARIERRGGRVVVRSGVGKGTEIRVHMPLGDASLEDAPLEWDRSADHVDNSEEQPT